MFNVEIEVFREKSCLFTGQQGRFLGMDKALSVA